MVLQVVSSVVGMNRDGELHLDARDDPKTFRIGDIERDATRPDRSYRLAPWLMVQRSLTISQCPGGHSSEMISRRSRAFLELNAELRGPVTEQKAAPDDALTGSQSLINSVSRTLSVSS